MCKTSPPLPTPLLHQPGCSGATPPPARARTHAAGAFADIPSRATGGFLSFVYYRDLRFCYFIPSTLNNSVSMFREQYLRT